MRRKKPGGTLSLRVTRVDVICSVPSASLKPAAHVSGVFRCPSQQHFNSFRSTLTYLETSSQSLSRSLFAVSITERAQQATSTNQHVFPPHSHVCTLNKNNKKKQHISLTLHYSTHSTPNPRNVSLTPPHLIQSRITCISQTGSCLCRAVSSPSPPFLLPLLALPHRRLHCS